MRLSIWVLVPPGEPALWRQDCLKSLAAEGENSLELIEVSTTPHSTDLSPPQGVLQLQPAPNSWRPRDSVRSAMAQRDRDGVATAVDFDDPIAAIGDADVVLSLLDYPVRDGRLYQARYGLWEFEHSHNNAVLASFWSVYHRDLLSTVRLVSRCGTELRVLYEGVLKTIDFSWAAQVDGTLNSLADWVSGAVRDLGGERWASAPTELASTGSREDAPSSISPRPWQRLLLPLKTIPRYLKMHWEALFTEGVWNVGIVREPIDRWLDPEPPQVEWLPPPRSGTFVADPFGLQIGDTTSILVEEFDHRGSRRGLISVIDVEGGTASGPRPAIELPCHMSYPQIIEADGEIYCVPETFEADEVKLFRAVDFPERWEEVGRLVSGPIVDATVFRHGGRWWMLGTRKDKGSESTLYGWWAWHVAGPWHEHRANPLKTDVRSSRPAGTPFLREGELYRPSQDCSRTYGGAITINRVMELTPDSFREEAVRVIRPDRRGPYPHGFHTLAAVGDITIVDGLRTRVRLQRDRWDALRQRFTGATAVAKLGRRVLAGVQRWTRLVSRPTLPRGRRQSSSANAR